MSAPFWPVEDPIGQATAGWAWYAFSGLLVWGIARASGMFTSHGALAAAIVAAVFAWGGGWAGVGLYVALFVLVAWATGHRAAEKRGDWEAASGAHGPRNAAQVVAKTGVAAACAVAPALAGNPLSFVSLAAAPIAVAVADTWAGELGILYGRAPKYLLSRRPVAPGRSGGTTAAGTTWAVLGAVFAGVAALLLIVVDAALRNSQAPVPIWPAVAAALAAVVGGVAGTFADSLLGETVQARWRCAECKALVEVPEHHGKPATVQAGLPFLQNPGVNLLGSIAGTAVGLLLLRVLS